MPPQVAEIHVVCREMMNVSDVTEAHFTSGWWVIAERHIRPGVVFALHEAKGQISYLQGEIESLLDLDRRDESTRIQVRVRRSLHGIPWRGGGSGTTGYLWAGDDFSDLPEVPTVLPEHLGGGNKPLKSLLEAETWKYPRAAELNASGSTGAGRNRQGEFLNVLARLVAAMGDQPIPYAFVDQAGMPWRLDVGAIRMAINAKMVAAAEDGPQRHIEFIKVTERFRHERAGIIDIWRQQDALRHVAATGEKGFQSLPENQDRTDGSIDPPDHYSDLDLEALSQDAFRKTIARSKRVREGQPEFRADLIAIYGRCAVTNVRLLDVLEAAHIIPHEFCGRNGSHVSNGLLLRADIHSLFDAQLIGFRYAGERLMIEVSSTITNTPYGKLHGKEVYLPKELEARPSPSALRIRQERLPLMNP